MGKPQTLNPKRCMGNFVVPPSSRWMGESSKPRACVHLELSGFSKQVCQDFGFGVPGMCIHIYIYRQI